MDKFIKIATTSCTLSTKHDHFGLLALLTTASIYQRSTWNPVSCTIECLGCCLGLWILRMLFTSLACKLNSNTKQCEALYKGLGDRVVFPNATAYSTSIGSYWSLKNVDVHPSCVILPSSAEDVSAAVTTLTLGATVWQDKCQFAVRGGGCVGKNSSYWDSADTTHQSHALRRSSYHGTRHCH